MGSSENPMWMDFTSDGDFELLIYDPRYFYFTRVQVGTAEENGNRDKILIILRVLCP